MRPRARRHGAAAVAVVAAGGLLFAGVSPATADIAGRLVAPDGQYDYVRPASGAYSLPFGTGDEADSAVMSADGSHAYLSSEKGEVVLVDRATNTWREASALDWGADPEGLAVSPTTGLIYVPQPRSHQIRVVNSDGQVVSSIQTDDDPTGVAISADGATLVTLAVDDSGDDVVDRIDIASGQITAQVKMDAGTGVVVADRAANLVYTVDPDGGRLSVAELSTGRVRSVIVGRSATAVALSPGQDTAYVVGIGQTGTGVVSIVDTATMTVRRTDVIGGDPVDVREAPHGGALFVALEDGFAVSDDLATGAVTGRQRLNFTPAGFVDTASGPLLFDGTGAIWGLEHDWPDVVLNPVVVGTARVGSKLTVQMGPVPAGATVTVKWRTESNTPITHGYGNPWVVSGHLLGRAVYAQVSVIYRNPDGSIGNAFASTARTAIIKAGKLAAGTPKITGTVKVGKWVAAKPGNWTSGTGFTYHWYAGGAQLKSLVNKPKFKVTPALAKALAGKKLTVRVTGAQLGYVSAAKTSKAVVVAAAKKTLATHPATHKK